MKTRTVKPIQIVALLLCFFTVNSFAMTHVVMFGGSLGFVHSPAQFNDNSFRRGKLDFDVGQHIYVCYQGRRDLSFSM
jgi:hypothetical protein